MVLSTPIPSEWSKEISEKYDPIRILGKGGFASVTLARRKDSEELVAIKIAGSSVLTKDRAYFHREIDILKELNHSNIMKVFESWEPKSKGGFAVVALSYSKGPTVQALLKYGGALSTIFSRVVIAQLIDAIAYLHSRAVIHRDIKPDNVIVTGASSSEDSIWENPIEDESAKNVDDGEYWENMRTKWKVTLIDFGFARALTPKDVIQPSLEIRKENLDASFHGTKIQQEPSRTESKRKSMFRSFSNVELDESLNSHSSRSSTTSSRHSRIIRRTMSALGNRAFAAPEILTKMHNEVHADPVAVTDTISNTVSEYGLLVDSYSLGCTLRYMMTGCLPHIRPSDAIAEQNSILYMIFSKCTSKKQKRQKHFRLVGDLPNEAQELIRKMTERAERNRISVRKARRNQWIDQVLVERPSDKIRYLDLAISTKEIEGKE